MTPQTPTTIALADPRWFGHHPTFFREFSASLLRLGLRVIAINDNPEEFRAAAQDITREMGLEIGNTFTFQKLDDPLHAFFRKSKEHDTVSVMERWRCLKRALAEAESNSRWRADMVFLPMLDPYIRFMPTAITSSRYLERPWSGLYFRNFHLAKPASGPMGKLRSWAKGDHVLRNPWCRSVAVLDERFMEKLESISGKPVIQFPDITNESHSAEETALSAEIRRRAKGRPIIALISMEKRKGVLTLLKAALKMKAKNDCFFMFDGMFADSTFSPEEIGWLRDISAAIDRGEHDHIHLNLDGGRIEDGAPFNSLIKTADIIYSAYEDFQGSSNTLTKAAVFDKPVIATRGECVGQRVEKYRLGLCIDQGDVEQCESAILHLLDGKDWEGRALRSQFESYRNFHSRPSLDEAFRQTISHALPDWKPSPAEVTEARRKLATAIA